MSSESNFCNENNVEIQNESMKNISFCPAHYDEYFIIPPITEVLCRNGL